MVDVSRYRAARHAAAGGRLAIINKSTFSAYSYCRDYEAGMIRPTLSTLALGATLLLADPAGFGQSAAYAQGCLPQGLAQQLVASGQAKPFSAFYGSLQQQGQVVSSCLVPSGGGYVYVVKLVKPNGEVVQTTVGP
jgi:hypothetical protein